MQSSQYKPLYDKVFYLDRDAQTRHAAQVISKFVAALVPIRSVIDVGCGVGTWLRAFEECGAEEIQGLDGAWVEQTNLVINRTAFRPTDLTAPPVFDRNFDLAISLEVAEHLPEEQAGAFVEYLVRLAPVVLFAAAIPGQGGRGHVNERWPSYWIERFEALHYRTLDCIRPKIWYDKKIPVWYRQNTFLMVSERLVDRHEKLREVTNHSRKWPTNMVHPELFSEKCSRLERNSESSNRWRKKVAQIQGELEEMRVARKSLRKNIIALVYSLLYAFRMRKPTRKKAEVKHDLRS